MIPPFTVILVYVTFGLFLFYQRLHIKNFRGASQGFFLSLNVFAFVAMLAGYAFLAYWGFTVSWLQAAFLLVAGFAIKPLFFYVEVKLAPRNTSLAMSFLGFIAMPACATLLWLSLP